MKTDAIRNLDQNFRTRTGQLRRVRTRASILTAAFELFDERGIDHTTVEHVRERARLARGSFYNYFDTYESMLSALAADIARQLNAEQSARFEAVPDLGRRIWEYIRYAILRVGSDRSCASVLVRITPLVGSLTDQMRTHAESDIRQAVKRGAISVPSPSVALDLGYGLTTVMLRRALESKVDHAEIEAAGLMLLRAFGVSAAKALRISKTPSPAMPQETLRSAVIAQIRSADSRVD